MPRLNNPDTELLEAAIVGFEFMRSEVERKIAELRGQIAGHEPSHPVNTPGHGAVSAPKRRTMSASARRRIALAQKKRWAAQKAESGRTATAAKPQKRAISAEGRARIIAATKKRWAAYRKAKAAQ